MLSLGPLAVGVSGYISSGGDWESALYGTGAGAVAGLVFPTSAFYSAASGFSSSIAGQAAGQYAATQSISLSDIDVGLAAASAVGGIGGYGLNKYLMLPDRTATSYILNQALDPTNPTAVSTASSITSGFVSGTTEASYQILNGDTLGPPNSVYLVQSRH